MSKKSASNLLSDKNQRGAALVTVVMISIILLTASVAILTAVALNSRNTSDVLAETEAFYAAESGLQSTINKFRNDSSVTYRLAVADPDLSTWLPYNWPTTGGATRVVIGELPSAYSPNIGTAYSLLAYDPDNSGTALTFYTAGVFLSGSEISADGKTIYYPNKTASPRTEIAITDAALTTTNFTSNPIISTFTLTKVAGGVTIPSTVLIKFRIDYRMTAPRSGVRSIWGTISQATSTAPIRVTFQTQNYSLLGSLIELCPSSAGGPGCTDVMFDLGTTPSVLYAYITAVEPFRVKLVSTGYGPAGAVKKLEAIIRRSLFDGMGAGAATTMIGTSTTPPGGLPFLFEPGTSNGVAYSGGNCSAPTGCVPSFGVTDPAILAYMNAHPPGGDPNQMQPPPQMITESLPDWQQTPAAMDTVIDRLRATAQNSGRYFISPAGKLSDPGDFANGTGITFCEGSCTVAGNGGGILVVTGMLTNLGGFSFKGMIIVTGEEGWERNGGGNGQVIGNVIIAPYNKRSYVPENLSTTFLAPRYYITGGGNSDILYGDIAGTLDNTSAISDFVAGVAEK